MSTDNHKNAQSPPTPLDDILHFVQNAPGKNLARIDAKTAIKSLILELIGEDEDFGETRAMQTKFKERGYRNKIRAELRKKVEDL